jgi:chemotaxis protein MotA
MSITTILGLILGFGAIIMTTILEGSSLSSLINLPGAMIVFGGTFGATLGSFPMETVLSLPKLIVKAITGPKAKPLETVKFFVQLADKARKQGLLSLEEEETKISDPFMKKGIMLVVDGVDPEDVRHMLQLDSQQMSQRHAKGYAMLEAMGGYAPTMGILGAIMGLISALSHMEDPSSLAHSIAVAFVASLYGVASANLLWLPLGSKLKKDNEVELLSRNIMMEGILAVQAGDNPYIIQRKLETFLPPKMRAQLEKEAGAEGSSG